MESHVDRRFERLGRLVTEDGVRALQASHVVICGMGGVGSWCAEALARSGIGRLTLVDFDQVAITNVNRQMPALDDTVGQPKVTVLAERLRRINPEAVVTELPVQIDLSTVDSLFSPRPDFVVDAIDQLQNKVLLLATCRREQVPVVSSSGAGGRLDPTQVRVADMAKVTYDPLARETRNRLRKKYGFPPYGKFSIPTVYSTEAVQSPFSPSHPDAERGKKELREQGMTDLPFELRNVVMGTACFVTSAFGMTCASVVVRELLVRHGISERLVAFQRT